MKKDMREQGLIEAYEKINKKKLDKKAEDERLAKELKEIRLNRQYMNANAAMVEETNAVTHRLSAETETLAQLVSQFRTVGTVHQDERLSA